MQSEREGNESTWERVGEKRSGFELLKRELVRVRGNLGISSPIYVRRVRLLTRRDRGGGLEMAVALVGESHHSSHEHRPFYDKLAKTLDTLCMHCPASIFLEFSAGLASPEVERQRYLRFQMEESMRDLLQEKTGLGMRPRACNYHLVDVRTTILGSKLESVFSVPWLTEVSARARELETANCSDALLQLVYDVYLRVYDGARSFFPSAVDRAVRFEVFARALRKIRNRRWKKTLRGELLRLYGRTYAHFEAVLLGLSALIRTLSNAARTTRRVPVGAARNFLKELAPLFSTMPGSGPPRFATGVLMESIHALVDVYFLCRLMRKLNKCNVLYIGDAHLDNIEKELRHKFSFHSEDF